MFAKSYILISTIEKLLCISFDSSVKFTSVMTQKSSGCYKGLKYSMAEALNYLIEIS